VGCIVILGKSWEFFCNNIPISVTMSQSYEKDSPASTVIPEDEDMNDDVADDGSTVIPDEIDEEVQEEDMNNLIDGEIIADKIDDKIVWNRATIVVPFESITRDTSESRWLSVSTEKDESITRETSESRWLRVSTKKENKMWTPDRKFENLPQIQRQERTLLSTSSDVVEVDTTPVTRASNENFSSATDQEQGIYLAATKAASMAVVTKLVDVHQPHIENCAYHLFPSKCACKNIDWIRVFRGDAVERDESIIDLSVDASASFSSQTQFWSDSIDRIEGGGKWLLNPSREHIDLTWFILLNLLAANRLGPEIKISQTKRLNEVTDNSHRSNYASDCVISVCTSSNALEIARVLYVLRTCGLPCSATDLLSWRAESTTNSGHYTGGKLSSVFPSYMVSSFISEKLSESSDGKRITTLDRCNYTSNFLRIRIAEIDLNLPENAIKMLDPPTHPRYKTNPTGKWLPWKEKDINDEGQPSPKRART